MAESPLKANTDLVSFTILVDGQKIKDVYQVFRIEVTKQVNKIPTARFFVIDGSPEEETFPISEAGDFVPGKAVEIKAGYKDADATLFKGVIIKHGIKVGPDKNAFLVISCYDTAVKMTVGRKSAYYLNQKDSDVIGTLIGNAGLGKSVEATAQQHKEIVQYYSTDWDFVVTRAEVNGQIVVVDDGTVTVGAPQVAGTPALVVGYGESLQEVEAEIDARTQLPSVTAGAWDLASQQVVNGTSTEPSVNTQGNLNGKQLAGVIGLSSFDLHSSAPIPQADLKTWAGAQLLKSRLARIRGTVTFQGNSQPKPGQVIELAGLGARFNGTAFIAAVHHRLEEGEWTTEVTFGLEPRWFKEEQTDIEAPLTSGLLPGIRGLHIGKVKQIDQDPDGETRVQIDIPTIAPTGDGVWARLANFYATNNAGSFFMPEIGDEVVLGFLNEDPRYPVILGSFYSSGRTPPYTPDNKNTFKAIVTNSQMKIWFDDVKKILQMETPGGHIVTLSDDAKTITLTDSNKNKIEMASGGITLDSPKDITLKAKGKIILDAAGGIDLKTQGDLNLEGMNVTVKANLALTAQGQASATLKASGNVTVQGAMVLIN